MRIAKAGGQGTAQGAEEGKIEEGIAGTRATRVAIMTSSTHGTREELAGPAWRHRGSRERIGHPQIHRGRTILVDSGWFRRKQTEFHTTSVLARRASRHTGPLTTSWKDRQFAHPKSGRTKGTFSPPARRQPTRSEASRSSTLAVSTDAG
eukprot:2042807-Heterocapsa_arctica.AAC.1